MQYSVLKTAEQSRMKFDPNLHRYTLDGMWIPGVTSVIESIGDTFRFVPQDIREAALRRGRIVHELTELEDTGKLTSEHLQLADASGYLGYLEAWVTFKRGVQIIATEQKVFHRAYRYAGTLDRVALMPGIADPALIEIKTGQIVPTYRLQTAAYQAAYNVEAVGLDGDLIRVRFVVVLKPDGSYDVIQHRDRSDLDYFLAALKMVEWKSRNR